MPVKTVDNVNIIPRRHDRPPLGARRGRVRRATDAPIGGVRRCPWGGLRRSQLVPKSLP